MWVEEVLKGKAVRERGFQTAGLQEAQPRMMCKALHLTVSSTCPCACAPTTCNPQCSDGSADVAAAHTQFLSRMPFSAAFKFLLTLQDSDQEHPQNRSWTIPTVQWTFLLCGHDHNVESGAGSHTEQFDTQSTYHNTQYIVGVQSIFLVN